MITLPRSTRLATHSMAGYSIVEMAIALAVIGIMLSGLAIPIGNQLREETYRKANRQVAEAVDAVVGYAITHKTPGFPLLYAQYLDQTSGLEFQSRAVAVPAARPYLPCPDTDDDGLENRMELVRPNNYQDPLLVGTVRESRFLLINRASSLSRIDQLAGSKISPLGDCERYSGNLPWRTLGLKPTDPWGSRLTYVVSPAFSIAAYGFDQLTRSTAFLPFILAGAVYSSSPIRSNSLSAAELGNTMDKTLPLIACPPSDVVDAATGTTRQCPLEFNLADDSSNSWSLEVDQRTNNMSPALSLYGYSFGRSAYARKVTDGLPFVIISHGLNRQGATTSDTVCVDVDNDDRSELVNASYGNCLANVPSGPTNQSGFFSIGTTTRRIDVSSTTTNTNFYTWIHATRRATLNRGNPSVVSEYEPSDDGNVFDDVVGWMTRRELLHRLRSDGILPVEVFDGLYTLQATYEL